MNEPEQSQPGPDFQSGDFFLSHERLEVYRLQLSFVTWVTDLLDEAEKSGARRLREVMPYTVTDAFKPGSCFGEKEKENEEEKD